MLIISLALTAQDSLLVTDSALDEVSGIVCGRRNPDLYYVINDSGGKPEVYALDGFGKVMATLHLGNVTNRDWEDIAIAPVLETGGICIFVAETGDNYARYPEIALYRFSEPMLKFRQGRESKPDSTAKLLTISDAQKLRIQFEDGARDCESVFIDPANADVYLVSKREAKVGLYLVKAPLDTLKINIAKRVLTLEFPMAVAADISPQRDKILIKTYSDIYCWNLAPGQAIVEALAFDPVKLPYDPEPQGEAVCFSSDGKSYLTLSEKHEGIALYLYHYPLNER